MRWVLRTAIIWQCPINAVVDHRRKNKFWVGCKSYDVSSCYYFKHLCIYYGGRQKFCWHNGREEWGHYCHDDWGHHDMSHCVHMHLFADCRWPILNCFRPLLRRTSINRTMPYVLSGSLMNDILNDELNCWFCLSSTTFRSGSEACRAGCGKPHTCSVNIY